MALAANKNVKTAGRSIISLVVQSGVTVWAGGLYMYDKATGTVKVPADTAGFEFAGMAMDKVIGDGTKEVPLDISGRIIKKQAVTGVTALTNVGDLVYITSDDVFTITPTTNTDAIGIITRWYSGTDCDVALFTPFESRCVPVA